MPASSRFTTTAKRSGLAAVLTAVTAGGVGAMMLTGPATPVSAAPDPCAASEVARTVAMVATHTGNYLEANPETDQTLTAISQQQGGPESVAALKAYFDANPQVAKDLQRLQQPLAALSGRCQLPVTVPQVLGLVQSVQQGSLPAAQNVGVGSAPAPGPQPRPATS
ncbi:MAG: hemophore [Actinomycetota bacterium]|nr:hemophore [Actinomycetota bacterium]